MLRNPPPPTMFSILMLLSAPIDFPMYILKKPRPRQLNIPRIFDLEHILYGEYKSDEESGI